MSQTPHYHTLPLRRLQVRITAVFSKGVSRLIVMRWMSAGMDNLKNTTNKPDINGAEQ
jgi:hypothetical protein